MSAKKVIIIGPAHPYRGGIANFNNSLADAFFKNGDDIERKPFSLDSTPHPLGFWTVQITRVD